MCSGSKRKLFPTDSLMEGELQNQKEGFFHNCSILLELSASDDLISFRNSVEGKGSDVNEASLWYGRVIGARKMALEERTPLMIAAMFGSTEVLKYILSTGCVDVNQACGSDGATALHCAAAGGSSASPEIVKLLLDASADPNSVDAKGNKPGDLIAPGLKPSCFLRKKTLEMMLKGSSGNSFVEGWASPESFDETFNQPEEFQQLMQTTQKDGNDKKEYPIDLTLPDIKNGIYGTDEFRMYTFKVKPCSRAYSHDWTECPFVHPGENARRRDPRKYHYSCVPCPEFRKGTCRQGDACEYAHGVFECWLHPAQYRTRLCKDETGCTRRVCFFAHKPEELRPLYASTGSAVPSPRSSSANVSPLDMSNMSPLALGSPSVLMHSTSTPPMSPLAATSSPMGSGLWQNQASLVPPTLQLPGSRLKTAMSARDMELDMDLLGLSQYHHQQQQQQQQMMDEISNLSSHTSWSNTLATALAASSGSRLGGVKPTNLEDVFGSLDPSVLSQLQGLSLKAATSQVQSPTGIQIRQNMNQQQQQQLRSSYPTNLSSSPVRASSSFGLDSSGVAAINARSAAFAKRSQSFIDRGAVNRHPGLMGSAAMSTSNLSDWGSPTGKLDWGVQGEELNKLRKSASFGFRSNNIAMASSSESMAVRSVDEPDVSWVQSLVKDVPPPVALDRRFSLDEQQRQNQYHLTSGGLDMFSPCVEQLYMEQEQMVA
ncbi:zinc finger protein [Macleaya cordata]|uniref:Zinc finger protein n=1 Tax=Macleaya cordata TaxID=56857 RepID=A0A200PWW8_MACCD|nr:zinc finger protein [Macleaya cordata]